MKPIKPLRPARGSRGDNRGDSNGNKQNSNKRTIRLPTNHQTLIKAAIIGKGGSQIKLISELTGCRVKVEDYRVVIYGDNVNVNNLEMAVDLVQSIINNVLCVFEHPNVICSIYEMGEEDGMKLKRYETPVIGSQTSNQQHQNYYRLGLVVDEPLTIDDEINLKVVDDQKRLVKSDHQLHSQRKERQLISEGLASSVSNFLKLDRFEGMERKLLVKVGLGRKVFYDAKRNVDLSANVQDKVYSFETFSKLDIGYGKDIKSSFRLEMGDTFASSLKDYLLKNNWKHEQTIKSATCYVVKLMEGILGSSGGKRLSFKVLPNGSSARIGKVKIALDKICYLDFCNLEESHPDLRLRFETEQYSRESTDETFNNFISSLKFNQLDQVDISNVPKELLNIFRIDSIRNKVKEVYCLNGLKITINKIQSKGNGWYEISMSSLQPYNELSSSEDILNVLSTMRAVLNGVCGERKHFRIVPDLTVNTTKKEETKPQQKDKGSTSYWSMLVVAAACTVVGFGLNRMLNK